MSIWSDAVAAGEVLHTDCTVTLTDPETGEKYKVSTRCEGDGLMDTVLAVRQEGKKPVETISGGYKGGDKTLASRKRSGAMRCDTLARRWSRAVGLTLPEPTPEPTPAKKPAKNGQPAETVAAK